ncbi:MAG: helicase-exonuclease AddAB subunit AddA [Clostridia bacterium]|nr:helicase-exonuclease AddAB subunit AddA [Clostridia bacterium]
MPNFTSDQKKAIETLGKDIIVTAAAGSGKTAVLSERVLNIILNEDTDVTDFLIVTFTNAAAAEMKSRISSKIADAIANGQVSPKKTRHLNRQLSLITRASITTIHSFCLDIIRSNFFLLDIDPRFRVLEEGEAELMKISSAEQMLEEMYGGKNPELVSNLCKWLGGGNDDKLISEIIKIYKFISSFSHPLEWLEIQAEKYNPDNLSDINSLEWIKEIKHIYKIKFEGLVSQAEELKKRALEYEITSYAGTFADDELQLKKLYDAFSDTWDELYAAAYDFAFCKLANKPKDADESAVEYLKNARDKIKDSAKDMVSVISKMSSQSIRQNLVMMYPLLTCLKDAVCALDRIYSEKKREASALDFGDFEHMALKILRDSENGVAKKLEDKYKYILVDEYQDCNPVQEELFSLISRKVGGESCNMFMVGDIKQSIYKFRQADPEIFIDKSMRYSNENSGGEKISLNKNFRSSNAVLDYVNHIFSRIMSTNVGEMEYTDSEKLYYREDSPPAVTDKDKCELIIASSDTDTECENKYELEAKVISSRISKLINEGYKYKDIVILYRGMGQKSEALEQEFKSLGIPYYLDSRRGYFETLEVGLFLSILRIIDNPLSDIPLTGVLRSPLFNFDENDLVKIRYSKKGMLFDALKSYSTRDDETALKCADFLNKLSKWRDSVISKPIAEFVPYILNESGLDIFAAGLPGGKQRCANLNLMTEHAKSFSAASGGGLFGLLEYMDRLQVHSDSGSAKTLSESSNVVRIMTIHKSKGLEFPVVFLAGCHTKFHSSDYSGNLLLHRKLGLGVEAYDFDNRVHYPLVSKEAIKEKIHIENISEEMRVMYVAMTRAKQKLICTAVVSDVSKMMDDMESMSYDCERIPLPFMVRSGAYLDWLAYSLMDEIILNTSPDTNVSFNEIPIEEMDKKTDVTINSDVREALEYKYPYVSSSSMPTKFSVSELKRRFDYEDALSAKLSAKTVLKSSVLDSDFHISSAEAGIINHLALRHMPIKNVTEETVNECCRELVNAGLLKEEELLYVNVSAIAGFFESPLGKRLSNAEKVFREESFNILVPQSDISGNQYAPEEDKVLIQGIIDCMFIENGQVIVIDFKTDKSLSEETENMYKTQLELYAQAAEKITKLPCREKYLYMLNKGTTINIK